MTDQSLDNADSARPNPGAMQLDLWLRRAEELRNSDAHQALALGEQAREEATRLGDVSRLARSLLNCGRTRWTLGDYGTARHNLHEALAITEEHPDAETQIRCLMNLGLVDMDQGHYVPASAHFLRALRLSRQAALPIREAGCLNNLGGVHEYLGDYSQATEYYLQALQVFEQHDDPLDRIIVRVNLGTTCQQLRRTSQALEYYRQAWQLALASNNKRYQGMAALYQGECYRELQQPEQALDSLEQALQLLRDTGYRKGEAQALSALGDWYLSQEASRAAFSHYTHALELAGTLEDQQLTVSVLIRSASALLHAGEADSALHALRRALSLAEKLSLTAESSEAHERLSRYWELREDYFQALAHYKAFHACQQQLFNDAQDKRTQTLLIQHEVEQIRQSAEEQRSLAEQLQEAHQELNRAFEHNQQLLEQASFHAHHDVLTGLPNRLHFDQLLQQAIAQAARQNEMFAVMLLDLDGFKGVNDSLGHQAGDELIAQVAQRFRSCLQRDDVVARFGGDEFTAIVHCLSSPHDAQRIAERLLAVLQAPFFIHGEHVLVGVSIGVSLFPRDGQDITTLTARADSAMYQIKRSHKGAVQIYSADQVIPVV